jgi:hypothetical protein
MAEQEGINTQEIYLKIKQKRERHADKINKTGERTQFQIGEKVLIKACRVSDALNKVVAKFCDVFEGPYIITARPSKATYELAYLDSKKGLRGKFNIRQLKRYHENDRYNC